jgi:hypothetical protein
MKSRLLGAMCASIIITYMPLAHAVIVEESGGLNRIEDASNPSNGLRYLDMTFSDGLSLADALSNARSSYANARLATASEFDDLFAAAGIMYDNPLVTASSGFDTGDDIVISSLTNYNSALRDILGRTTPTDTRIWTAPDGNTDRGSTRDALRLTGGVANLFQLSEQPPNGDFGWLLVSDPVVVPVPAAVWLFGSGLLGLIGVARRKVRA